MDTLVGFIVVLAVFGAGVLVARRLKQGLRGQESSDSGDSKEEGNVSSHGWLLFQALHAPLGGVSFTPGPCDVSPSPSLPANENSCASASDATSCAGSDSSSPTCDPGCCEGAQSGTDPTN